MDLYSIKTIKELLKLHKTIPKEHLGQNFLLEKRVASKMLKAAELSLKDIILEIGPGIGTLTQELAKNAKQIVAVEKDSAMVEILKETTETLPNIQIIQADILKLNLTRLSYPRPFGSENPSGSERLNLAKDRYKVVANLPYYITSPVIRMFLETESKPQLMVLMVQKEVAQRICAKPRMNLLAVSVQFYAHPEIISYVPKSAFWPWPNIASAIIKLILNKESLEVSSSHFFRVVKAGFKQPRKQLGNNFCKGLSLSKSNIDSWLKQNDITPTQRAETLSLEDWVSLAKSLPKT